MKPPSVSSASRLSFSLFFLLALLTGLSLKSQSLGGYTFQFHAAQDLQTAPRQGGSRAASLEKELSSSIFLNAVGGVAFAGIAAPHEKYSIVGVDYDPSRQDGDRVVFTVENQDRGTKRKIYGTLPDWQLVPIARFADTPDYSCVTLFGRLVDKDQEDEARRAGGYIVNYHKAFANSLLGLRLLHADGLILTPTAAKAMVIDGKEPRGKGEQECNEELNLIRQARVRQALAGERFQAYVICDVGQNVTWRPGEGGKISMTGDPYWYFWRTSSDGQIESLKECSRRVSAAVPTADGINPPVYAALVNTMRYAALFRLVQEQQPAAWQRFLAKIHTLQTEPKVRTPTVLFDPLKPRRTRA